MRKGRRITVREDGGDSVEKKGRDGQGLGDCMKKMRGGGERDSRPSPPRASPQGSGWAGQRQERAALPDPTPLVADRNLLLAMVVDKVSSSCGGGGRGGKAWGRASPESLRRNWPHSPEHNSIRAFLSFQ
jgi:hypothetical protein